MPIELNCNGCGQRLRVGDDSAGKHARCPQCGNVQPVPAGASPPGGYTPSPSSPRPAGGPAGTYDEETRPASSASSPFPGGGNPFADEPRSPYAPPQYTAPQAYPQTAPYRYQRAHRGGLILALSLIGWVGGLTFCLPAFCCIAAWVMGAQDLHQMRIGRMDRSGHGLTQAGMIIGIIGTLMMGLGVLCVAFAVIADA